MTVLCKSKTCLHKHTNTHLHTPALRTHTTWACVTCRYTTTSVAATAVAIVCVCCVLCTCVQGGTEKLSEEDITTSLEKVVELLAYISDKVRLGVAHVAVA